jgi:hypothetical protein
LSSLPANLKRKITKDQYLGILRQMEEEGKGKIEETNNATGPKAIVFTKKKNQTRYKTKRRPQLIRLDELIFIKRQIIFFVLFHSLSLLSF